MGTNKLTKPFQYSSNIFRCNDKVTFFFEFCYLGTRESGNILVYDFNHRIIPSMFIYNSKINYMLSQIICYYNFASMAFICYAFLQVIRYY